MTDIATGAIHAPRAIHDEYMTALRQRRLYGGLTLLVFALLMITGFMVANDRNAGGFWAGLPHILDFPSEVLAEAWAKRAELPDHFVRYFPALVETINIAAVATLTGVFAGGYLSLLATPGLSPWKWAIGPVRRVLEVLRAVPEIVIALVLIFVLGGGPVPAMIAIALHTTGAIGKLFSEVNENADRKPTEGLQSVGASWHQRMWLGVIPQVAPNWLSYALLRFEINIRASAILGFVGAGGIGYELRNAISWGQGRFDQAAAIFLLLFGAIVLFDQLSSHYRNRLTKGGRLPDLFKGTSDPSAATRLFRRKKRMALTIPLILAAYAAYVFVAFDIAGLSDRLRLDNAKTLLADTYSYKTHVTRDNRSGDLTVAIEGERKGLYPDGTYPDWVEAGDTTVIDLPDDHEVRFTPDEILFDIPGYGRISAIVGARGIETILPDGELPDWISTSRTRLDVTTPAGRLTVTRNKAEVFRYFGGWELFFFTLDSPFHGKGPLELAGLTFADPITDRGSNLMAMWSGFWNNAMWRHADVAWALFETILMACLGTFGAAILTLPLAFLAARNFTPLQPIRFAMRRLFDFFRGVDALIFTIILSRAFGPGPLTGALAILLTDTGSFGKFFSEALENVDEKQIEGVRSTGAKPIQRIRFGVIPQVAPVLLSQVLYFLESNTRSATIVGAITGGGIGLLLTQAIITQKDWEEVTYYIVLILVMVMIMDRLSGWLRRKLIHGGA